MPVTIEKIFIKTDNNANEIPDLLKPCMNKIYQNLDCIEPYETKYGCDADKFEVFWPPSASITKIHVKKKKKKHLSCVKDMLHLPKLIQNNDDRRKNLKINIIGDHEEYNEIIEKSTIEEIEIKKTSTKDENE